MRLAHTANRLWGALFYAFQSACALPFWGHQLRRIQVLKFPTGRYVFFDHAQFLTYDHHHPLVLGAVTTPQMDGEPSFKVPVQALPLQMEEPELRVGNGFQEARDQLGPDLRAPPFSPGVMQPSWARLPKVVMHEPAFPGGHTEGLRACQGWTVPTGGEPRGP